MLSPQHPKLISQYQIVNSKSLSHPIAKRLAHPTKPADHDLVFMQNKPNFLMPKMNATFVPTEAYENENVFILQQNKPNQTQLNPVSNAKERCSGRRGRETRGQRTGTEVKSENAKCKTGESARSAALRAGSCGGGGVAEMIKDEG
jgi:hypothetical protein